MIFDDTHHPDELPSRMTTSHPVGWIVVGEPSGDPRDLGRPR